MEIIERQITKDGDVFVVLETAKQTFTFEQLFNELQNIQRQKLYLIEQSRQLKRDYDKLEAKEAELQSLLDENGGVEFEGIEG